MVELDEAYIHAPQHGSDANFDPLEPDEIPLIDLSRLINSDEFPNVVSEIGDGCENWGFFQVINHGVPPEARRRVENAARVFFDLTAEEKQMVKRDEVNPMGYYDGEHTKNVRDWKEVFDAFLNNPTVLPASPDTEDEDLRRVFSQWPENPSDFREAFEDYAGHVEKLALKLLELISLSLGLPEDRFNGYFKKQISFLRVNRYPPCPHPELALGVGPHKDADILTVLALDEIGGLQVSRRSDGVWIPIRPVPGALIIDLGNCMEMWTNDKHWRAEHRMVNTTKDRFSIPFFMLPSHYVEVKPLEEIINEQNPPKYKGYNWGKFVAARNRSDYKKLDAETIQIDQLMVSL